nr:thiamine pyrophosphate-binding protein [Natronorubrum texcoconense]
MRSNEAVIDRPATNGIDTLFGIPSKQTLPLNESIGERDDIEFVMARHERSPVPQWDCRVNPRRYC